VSERDNRREEKREREGERGEREKASARQIKGRRKRKNVGE